MTVIASRGIPWVHMTAGYGRAEFGIPNMKNIRIVRPESCV